MTHYPEGSLATERFLALFEPCPGTLREFLAVDAIRVFCGGESRRQQRRTPSEAQLLACGFDPAQRSRLLALCQRLQSRPYWITLTRNALAGEDQRERWLGLAVAERLALPTREAIVVSLEKDPLDTVMWHHLVKGTDEAGIDESLALADRLFDLDAIATGPSTAMGLGPGFTLHFCVGWLLGPLGRFPGKGAKLIRLALKSPSVLNRLG